METYTFHVSIPNTGRVWRKIELTGDQTLEDLHFAIQDAFDFDADHLYSFFMSGRAWDPETEYCLPRGADPWGLDLGDEDEGEDEGGDELDAETKEALAAALGDRPAPETFDEMLGMVRNDPALREVVAKLLVEQTGAPAGMVDLVLSHADELSTLTPEAFAREHLDEVPEELLAQLADDDLFEDEMAGDVRETALASLGLKKGQTFLYLFDYGDEWRFKVRVHAINPAADPAVEYPRLVEAVGDAPSQYGGGEEWEDEEEDADV